MKTKKEIIALLKQHQTATIAFNGLASKQAVDNARQEIITQWQKQVDGWNRKFPPLSQPKVSIIIDDTQISVSVNQFQLLPKYPKSGKLTIRSKDFIIDGCYCQFADIQSDTFDQTDKTKAFQMKSGSTILLSI